MDPSNNEVYVADNMNKRARMGETLEGKRVQRVLFKGVK